MRRFIKKYMTAIMLFCFMAAAMAQAPYSVTGMVTDKATGRPLPGANIMVKHTVLGAAANLRGEFRIVGLNAGQFTLVIHMMGYKSAERPFTLAPGKTPSLHIAMEVQAVQGPAVVITASKRQQPLETTPVSVDEVRGADIAVRSVISVDEVLANSAGVGVIDGQIDIRGSTGFNWTAGSRVLLLLDGHPLIGGDTGGINWDAIAPEEIAQVEIVKGAGSALYGSSAMAGVINILTRDPSETPETRVKLTYGLYDEPAFEDWIWSENFITRQIDNGRIHLGDVLSTRGVTLSHSRKLGKTGLRLNMTQRSSTGYQQNGDYERWNFMGKTRTDLGNGQQLNVSGGWSVNDHGDVLQWESLERPLMVPQDELGNSVRYEKSYINADFRKALSARTGLTAKAHGYHTFWKNNFFDNQDQAKNDRLGAELQIDRISGNHTVTSGIEGVLARTRSDIYGNRAFYDGALYIEDMWRVNPLWTVTLGARLDVHHVENLGTDSQISPRVGTVLTPWQGGLWRMTAGRGFRAPSIAEVFAQILVSGFNVIPNLELTRAERAWSLETGLHQVLGWPEAPLNPMFDLDAALFYSFYDNMIDVDWNDTLGAIQFDYFGRARIWGAEARINAALMQRTVETRLGYTWLSHKRMDTGGPLPYRPNHRLNLGVTVHRGRFFLGWDYRYAGRADAVAEIYATDPRVPMHVMDGRVGVSWNKYRITLELKNMRNYHYTLRQRFLEPLRQIFITVESVIGKTASFE